ncbi:MAG: LysR family transcriptional regulator [Polyangiaceae bacterium]
MYDGLFAQQGLSLDRLRTFLRVVHAGNIALAAPGDPIRQSQYSRQISELETFFGQELFARRGRTRALTPAGERLARSARDAFDRLADLHAEAHTGRATFTLGAGDSLLHGFVIARLGPALAKLPKVQLSLVSLAGKDILERIADARLDFGIVRATELPRGLRSAALGAVDYAVYAPRRMLAKGASLDDLVASAPFALQESEPRLNERLLEYARSRGVSLNVSLVCETFPQAVLAAQSGHHAAFLPTLARDALLARGVVEVPSSRLPKTTAKIALVWQERTARVRALGETVAKTLSTALRLR